MYTLKGNTYIRGINEQTHQSRHIGYTGHTEKCKHAWPSCTSIYIAVARIWSMQKGRTHTCMNTHSTAVRDKSSLLPLTDVPIRSPCLSSWSPVSPSACLFMTRCWIDGLFDGYWELQPGGHHGKKKRWCNTPVQHARKSHPIRRTAQNTQSHIDKDMERPV